MISFSAIVSSLILNIVEYILKFLIANDSVLFDVMLRHYLVKFNLCNIMTNFVHSSDYVFFCDHTRSVSIELIKNSLELIIIQKGLDIKSSDQEFSVVDFSVSEIVNFTDDLFDLFLWNIDIRLLNSDFKLFSINHSSSIFIELNELSSQLLNASLVSHFDKHVHGSLL